MASQSAKRVFHESGDGRGASARASHPASLIVFYSLSGHTRTLARAIQDASGSSIEEILERRARAGIAGEVGALLDSLLVRSPSILPMASDPADFDLLVLGGPVWAGRIAAPVRSYARQFGARAKRVAFFSTFDSDGAAAAFQELANVCGKRPEAILAVPAHALVSGAYEADLRRFVKESMGLRAPAAVG